MDPGRSNRGLFSGLLLTLFVVEHRGIPLKGGEQQSTLAFLSADFAACLSFMERNKDAGKRESAWWWAVYLAGVDSDWMLSEGQTSQDLWYFSWDAIQMNYQPCSGYLKTGTIDTELPLPELPPARAS